MKKNKDILFLISGFLIILLVIIGVSYAYFTANITGGEETTTIEVRGGRMTIIYDGGDDINITNILPNNNPVAIKRFTVTGFNDTKVAMAYKISLVVENNEFTSEALKYKLISENTDNNGLTIPSITTLTSIPSGASIIELGTGSFKVPTDGNKIHTYDLEIYFPNEDYDQNIEQEKKITAYILTENYFDPCAAGNCLGDLIFAQGGGASAIETKDTPDFSKTATSEDTGLYAAEDEYGTSYYYRGEKNLLNNNIIWGGFQWKIVRINGDRSVRLVYNGTQSQFTTNGTVNDTGEDTQIGTSGYSLDYNDAKYVGYMYGGERGVASTQRNGLISAAATYNETSNNIKEMIDNWYITNILNKTFESQVVSNLFCNDRQLANEVGGANSGQGYGDDEIYYAPHHRLYTNDPTFKCVLKNNCFTTSADTVAGNGDLTYPVGLLTADEIVMAGSVASEGNSTNYLYTNQNWWLMSPAYMEESTTYGWSVETLGNISANYVYSVFGSRPSISITYNTLVSGTGTASDPFVAS